MKFNGDRSISLGHFDGDRTFSGMETSREGASDIKAERDSQGGDRPSESTFQLKGKGFLGTFFLEKAESNPVGTDPFRGDRPITGGRAVSQNRDRSCRLQGQTLIEQEGACINRNDVDSSGIAFK